MSYSCYVLAMDSKKLLHLKMDQYYLNYILLNKIHPNQSPLHYLKAIHNLSCFPHIFLGRAKYDYEQLKLSSTQQPQLPLYLIDYIHHNLMLNFQPQQLTNLYPFLLNSMLLYYHYHNLFSVNINRINQYLFRVKKFSTEHL
jgi:hypothetical protein